MRILIAGAGKAGYQLAKRLCEEKHSVVIIDTNQDALTEAEAHLDILTICGSSSNPHILEKAEIGKFDLCIAVTDCDEVNILTCIYANAAGVPRKITRVKSPDFIHANDIYDLSRMGIDLVINQKQECTHELYQRLMMPGAFEVFDLFEGMVTVAGFRITANSPLTNKTPATCDKQNIIRDIRMMAIRRDDKLIIPYGDTLFKCEDMVYIIGTRDKINAFAEWVCPQLLSIKKVIIAGGGDLGLMLAKKIEREIECILLERDEERAQFCCSELQTTLVLKGDALANSTLAETGISQQTAFIALTGDDEDNIMNCLMARKQGAGFTAAQITRIDYIPIINNLNLIDNLVSPYISTTHAILHYLRSQHIKAAALLHNLPGELLDIIIDDNSKMRGKAIKEIKMPRTAIIATVLRENTVVSATGELELQAQDRLVIFAHHDAVKKIQAMFLK